MAEELGGGLDSALHCCVVWCMSLPVLGLCSELMNESKGREASMGPVIDPVFGMSRVSRA